MKYLPCLFIYLSFPFWVSGQISEIKPSKEVHTLELALQQAIDSIYAAHPTAVGVMAHVEAPNRNISWSGAAGYADKDTKTPLEADQPALIASSIKTYVSATILRLVEMDKISLQQSIGSLLGEQSQQLLIEDGYDLDAIKVKHLLSHTSGVEDYVSSRNVGDYFDFVDENPQFRWTREKQIQLTVEKGDPLGAPGQQFNYADANYLLLTEIIEGITKQPFYTSMRTLLKYEGLGLIQTWFPTLEDQPADVKPLVHQYYGEHNWDSYDIDPSWDLYGGGGIATTTKEIAQFSYHFFNGDIVENEVVRDSIFTEIKTKETENNPYYLGLSKDTYHGLDGYGHGGFWATLVLYFPDLDASVSVYILERDERILRRDVLEVITKIIK